MTLPVAGRFGGIPNNVNTSSCDSEHIKSVADYLILSVNDTTWLFTMTVDTTRKGIDEYDVTEATDQRRRKTDFTQPLDYETEELVKEYIESQQRPASFPKSLFLKLFKSS